MKIDLVDLLLLMTLAWPLLLAVGLIFRPSRPWVPRLLPVAPLPALACSLLPLPLDDVSLSWLLLGSTIALEEIAGPFLLFSAILWLVGLSYRPAARQEGFAAWSLLTMTGNFGVLLAQNVPTFFLFYALMGLASAGLVLQGQGRGVHRAARLYLGFVVLGEMLLLSAMLLLVHNAGTLDLEHVGERVPDPWLLGLLLAGFGIKAGVPLLHFALPRAYAVAPPGASVPLAGALLHLGLYGWIRFLPLGESTLPGWALGFVAVGVLAVIYATIAGLPQRNPRSLLAYSSMSQMGLMTVGIGLGLLGPDTWDRVLPVLLLYALHHALAKGALFYGLGLRRRSRRWLWLPALVLAGAPLTGGALAKGLLKQQVGQLDVTWAGMLEVMLPLASISTGLLMLRFLYLAFRQSAPADPAPGFPWWLLLTLMLSLPWLWPLAVEPLTPLWSAAWPLLVAALLGWGAWRSGAGLHGRLPQVPPGDLFVLLESRLATNQGRPHHAAHHPTAQEATVSETPAGVMARLTVLVAGWQVSVMLFLLVLFALFFTLVLAGQ